MPRARKKKGSGTSGVFGGGFRSGSVFGGGFDPESLLGMDIDSETSGLGFDTARDVFDSRGIPLIAGYTYNSVGANDPSLSRVGLDAWQQMTPEERFQNSALGKSLAFSTQRMSNGKMGFEQTGRDVAGWNNYWGDLAGNMMYGGPTPDASLPRVGASGGVEGEAPFSREAERVGGGSANVRDIYNVFDKNPLDDPNLVNEASRVTDAKGASYDAWAQNMARRMGLRYDDKDLGVAAQIRQIFDLLRSR